MNDSSEKLQLHRFQCIELALKMGCIGDAGTLIDAAQKISNFIRGIETAIDPPIDVPSKVGV